jgi:hypothetical protein
MIEQETMKIAVSSAVNSHDLSRGVYPFGTGIESRVWGIERGVGRCEI